jgi:hypothetical protein
MPQLDARPPLVPYTWSSPFPSSRGGTPVLWTEDPAPMTDEDVAALQASQEREDREQAERISKMETDEIWNSRRPDEG